MKKIAFLNQTRRFFFPCQENGFYPYSLRKNALIFYALTIVLIRVLALGSGWLLPKTDFFADVSSQLIIYLTNQERQKLGLSQLKENPMLDAAALKKAQDMIANNYFSHNSPDGLTPWYFFKSGGYYYRYAGENLAIDFFESSDVVNAWMNSVSHKANILNNNYEEIGVAVLQGKINNTQTFVVVQFFGAPKNLPQNVAVAAGPARNAAPNAADGPAAPSATPLASPTPQLSPRATVSPTHAPTPTASPVETVATTETTTSSIGILPQAPVISSLNPDNKPFSASLSFQQSELISRVVDTMSNPDWLYLGVMAYLLLVMILGIFSRIYTPYPQAFLGIVAVVFLTAFMLYLPDTDTLLSLNLQIR